MKTSFSRTISIVWYRSLAVGVVCVSILVRLKGISERSLWFDEAIEYWTSITDIQSTLSLNKALHLQPPLYSILLHYWLLINGSVVWIRLLSVSFSVISIISIMLVARKIIGDRGSLVGGAFFTVFPVSIRYSQDASEYALLLAASSLFMLASYRVSTSAKWYQVLLWSLCGVVTIYSHYGGGILVFSTGIMLVGYYFSKKRRKDLPNLLGGILLGVLLCLPLLKFFILQRRIISITTTPPFVSIIGEINTLNIAVAKTYTYLLGLSTLSFPAVARFSFIFTIVLLFCSSIAIRNPKYRLVLIWNWGVFFVYFIFVRLSIYAYGDYGFRYTLLFLPGFIVMLASIYEVFLTINVKRMKGIMLSGFVLFLILFSSYNSTPIRNLFSSLSIELPSSIYSKENVKALVGYLEDNLSEEDKVYVLYMANPTFRYYSIRSGLEKDSKLSPDWLITCSNLDKNSESVDCRSGNIYYGANLRNLPVEEKITSIKSTLQGSPASLWLVSSHEHYSEIDEIIEALQEQYYLVEEHRTNGGTAVLIRKR